MYSKYDIEQAHPEWSNNIDRWQFLIDSYYGGKEYRDGKYLLGYLMEAQEDYEERLDNTALDNHVSAVVSIYNAFLFRQPPKRDMGSLALDPGLEAFMADADLEGRTFSAIMRDVSTYSSVYGHVWCVIDKPETTAYTRAEELAQGLRPYISLFTPENVIDWSYSRASNGAYYLTYLKVIESRSSDRIVWRIYRPDRIEVVYMEKGARDPVIESVTMNALGRVPALCVYTRRSPIRGIGVSDVGDVADLQRSIYNELSECEQLIRLTNHPSLVKTASTQAAAGAGAIIQMPEDLQADLKPYLLQPNGSSLDGILNAMKHKIEAIDRIAHMGGIRSIESRRLSGVALATEFQLLNAKLAAKGEEMEFAEEQIWRLYAQWQGMVWDGSVDYPDSFNIQDKYNDMNMLKLAKDAGPKSLVVQQEIERQMLRILVENEDRYEELVTEIGEETEKDEASLIMDSLQVYEKVKQIIAMPSTGNADIDRAIHNEVLDEAIDDPAVKQQLGIVHEEEEEEEEEHPSLEGMSPEDRQSHLQSMLMEGYSNDEIIELHPEVDVEEIVAAAAAAAESN